MKVKVLPVKVVNMGLMWSQVKVAGITLDEVVVQQGSQGWQDKRRGQGKCQKIPAVSSHHEDIISRRSLR